jgi:uncharacterized membrane protein
MSTFLQWVHVTAAVIGVGGMAFLLLILMPSLGALPAEQRDLLAKQVMKRFRWMIWSAILVLLLSGLYTVRLHYWDVAWGRAWALLTVKIVLALFVFVIVLALTLPFKLFERVRARRRLWLSIAVGLAVVVILIAAYLRR